MKIQNIKNIKLWAKQILFWRAHLDVFIEQYFGVKLKDVQKVVSRSFGNCSD